MLQTRIQTFKPEGIVSTLGLCFCIAVLIAGFYLQETAGETTAQNNSTQLTEAQQAFALAEGLRANWTEASLRHAIDEYNKATLLWTSHSDFANASEATLKSGDVHFLLSEYKQALERYQNAEVLAQKSGDWLARARALSQIGRVHSYLGNNGLAKQQLTAALRVFEQHETNRPVSATNAYGEALSNLAEVSYATGNFVKATEQLDSALNILQNDPNSEAKVHLFKAYIAGTIGDREKAFTEISSAHRLYQLSKNKRGEAIALTAMGLWHSSQKKQHRAIELHNEANQIFQRIGDRFSEAMALNAIGQVYQIVKEHSIASSYYTRAFDLFHEIGALDAASGTACAVGEAQARNNDLDQALASYERCLNMSRTAAKRRNEAYALQGIATVYSAQQRYELALKQYQNVHNFCESIGDVRGQAMALNEQAKIFLLIGENQKALDLSRRTLQLNGTKGDNEILLSTLYNLARANLALGFHDTALSTIKQSFELIEDLRANVESPDFRASYFSGVRKHFELCIDILVQLERLRPGEGFAAEALFVSEKSRARLLIDLLRESRANILAAAGKELVRTERTLRGLLQAHARYRMNISLSGKDSSEMAEVEHQEAQLRSRYQVVQAQLREQNPQLFSFEEFSPAGLERIQKELRDTDTMLLEYALGDERSYLWAVTSNSIHVHQLPGRKILEDAAAEFYRLITARQGSGNQSNAAYQTNIEAADRVYSETAKNLSKLLLGPVADQLGNRRLIVVSEGALQYIPFDVLPPLDQTAGSVSAKTHLLEMNEVVVLPSASTLIAIRGAQSDKAAPGKVVAVIADPVFSESDDRLHRAADATAVAASAHDSEQPVETAIEDLSLARLPYASEEADAISAVAPRGTALVARGVDASYDTVMSPDISRAQIVHFATHAFLDDERPEFSAIVLTMVDRNGAKTNGLMPLPDIYSLDLSAALVVLSACQTALGKDIKGEGHIGLAHSFISAGANSVVASLWKVDDRATAVLMAEFYKGMLQKGMTPSAALRSAKLKMMHDDQWSAPYYWAGFVLQGEYANRIVVEPRASLRASVVVVFLLILTAAATLFVLYKRKRWISPHSSLTRNMTSK